MPIKNLIQEYHNKLKARRWTKLFRMEERISSTKKRKNKLVSDLGTHKINRTVIQTQGTKNRTKLLHSELPTQNRLFKLFPDIYHDAKIKENELYMHYAVMVQAMKLKTKNF